MEIVQRDIDDYLKTVRALANQVAAYTDCIDSERQPPLSIADDMAARGFTCGTLLAG